MAIGARGGGSIFKLEPIGPEVSPDAAGLLAQIGGQFVGAVVGPAVRTWLMQDNGQLVLMIWPRNFRARFDPLLLLDEHGDMVAEGGESITAGGAYLKPGDTRSLGHELAFCAWGVARGTQQAREQLGHRLGFGHDGMRKHAAQAIIPEAPRDSIQGVSFDVFLQRFAGGEAADADPAVIVKSFAKFVDGPLSEGTASVTTGDGGADVYGLGACGGIMVNHASGYQIWEALIGVADAAMLTILPVGCPACVTRPALLEDLPEDLQQNAQVVTTGEQLLSVIRG